MGGCSGISENHLNKIIFNVERTAGSCYRNRGYINSSHITTISDNPKEIQALTLSHFLIGEPLISVVNQNAKSIAALQPDGGLCKLSKRSVGKDRKGSTCMSCKHGLSGKNPTNK